MRAPDDTAQVDCALIDGAFIGRAFVRGAGIGLVQLRLAMPGRQLSIRQLLALSSRQQHARRLQLRLAVRGWQLSARQLLALPGPADQPALRLRNLDDVEHVDGMEQRTCRGLALRAAYLVSGRKARNEPGGSASGKRVSTSEQVSRMSSPTNMSAITMVRRLGPF
jgi:hypothetical protein